MKIVADENIPYVREAFSSLGEVVTLPGRTLTPDAVRDAELLLVRSVTRVNHSLLDGSAVRFVATATAGEDHLNKAYLDSRGIAWASAPGCNAGSVADYVTSTLLRLAHHFEFDLTGMKLGVVGVGNVGRRVVQRASALGMDCVLNDPPLAEQSEDPRYRPLEEIYDCDIVTFHVPLVKEDPHPTFHLADDAFLHFLKRGAIVINTSRGPVVDNAALARILDDGHVRAAALDVWEGEPAIDTELLERVFLGTPHIAGYSFDSKINGTRMVYEAACRFLGIEPAWDPSPSLPVVENPVITVDGSLESVQEAVSQAVFAVYDVRKDDEALRGLYNVPLEDRPAFFDRLRRDYPQRREFLNFTARIWPPNHEVHQRLAGLGFTCKDE